MSPEGCLQLLRRLGRSHGSGARSWGATDTIVPVSMNRVPSGRTYSRLSPIPSPITLHHATFRQAAVRSSRARPLAVPSPRKSPPARADQGWTRATTLGESRGRAVAAPEDVGAQAAGP